MKYLFECEVSYSDDRDIESVDVALDVVAGVDTPNFSTVTNYISTNRQNISRIKFIGTFYFVSDEDYVSYINARG